MCTTQLLFAPRHLNLVKGRNVCYLTIFVTYCFAHNCYRYVRTDFALGSALGIEALLQRWIMVNNDIRRQYLINLRARMEQRLSHLAAISEHIRGAIPSMHVRGHSERCQLNCLFSYTKYSGMTREGAWAE